MALKTKRNKRSLVTLKRKEPSAKNKEINEFTRLVIDGQIELANLLPKEDVSEEELSQHPSIDDIAAEMTSKLNHDLQHDTEVMDEILTKYENHPLGLRLQMTLLQALAKGMSPEQKDELYNYVMDENNVCLEPDDALNDKIFDSISLGNEGRTRKCIKNLEACIRRIEAKRTPHTFHDRPVYSFESLVHENLCFPNQEEGEASNYYQPPAAYSIAYTIYAEKLMTVGNMFEALDALNKSISWNPYNAATRLAKANIFAEISDRIRTLDVLEAAYPFIVTVDELTHYYLIHCMLLLDDENEESNKLAMHLIRLSKYLVEEPISHALISSIKEDTDLTVENISHDEFMELVTAAGIPVGISDGAIKALEKTIATYLENESTVQDGEELQKELDKMKNLSNAFTEI